MGVIMTYGLYKVGQSNREQVYLSLFRDLSPPLLRPGPSAELEGSAVPARSIAQKDTEGLTCAAFAHLIGNWRARRCGRGSI